MNLLTKYVEKKIAECEQAKKTDTEIKNTCQDLKQYYQPLLNVLQFIIQITNYSKVTRAYPST